MNEDIRVYKYLVGGGSSSATKELSIGEDQGLDYLGVSCDENSW